MLPWICSVIRSQKTSKWGKNISDTLACGTCATSLLYHILTSSETYYVPIKVLPQWGGGPAYKGYWHRSVARDRGCGAFIDPGLVRVRLFGIFSREGLGERIARSVVGTSCMGHILYRFSTHSKMAGVIAGVGVVRRETKKVRFNILPENMPLACFWFVFTNEITWCLFSLFLPRTYRKWIEVLPSNGKPRAFF